MQRKSNLYTFGFAGAICVCCALILANAATILKPIQDQNAELDVLVNILGAVGHDSAALKTKGADHVKELFAKEFTTKLLDENNNESNEDFMKSELMTLGYPQEMIDSLLPGTLLARFNAKKGMLARKAGKKLDDYDPGYKLVYVHQTGGAPDAYVIPIMGFGLWDIIKGYLALGTDLNTVKGVTFYEHKETPGLGARVTEAWFMDNWKGKKILNESGDLVSIAVAKGLGSGDHQVDGISGATLTGNGINQFVMQDLQRYEPYFKTLRGN